MKLSVTSQMEVIEQCFDLILLVTRYWKTYHVQCNYFVAVLSKTVVPHITHTFDIKLEFLLLKTLEHVVYTSTVFHPLPFFFAVLYSSGTSIASFPSDGLVIKQKLNHQGNEVVTGETKIEEDVAVLGLYQVPGPTSGRIVLYGDSNCLDNAHMEKGTDY